MGQWPIICYCYKWQLVKMALTRRLPHINAFVQTNVGNHLTSNEMKNLEWWHFVSFSVTLSTLLFSNQSWDVFKTVSRKSETIYETTTNWFEVAAKTFKVLAYIVIFVCVLASAIASKASLLLMTHSMGNVDQVCLDQSPNCLYVGCYFINVIIILVKVKINLRIT